MEDELTVGDILFTLLLCAVMLVGVVAVTVSSLNQRPVSGRVTDVSVVLSYPNQMRPSYVAQMGGGVYFNVGKSAGVNLRVDDCYLLRRGLFSSAYNLFEPVECEKEW